MDACIHPCMYVCMDACMDIPPFNICCIPPPCMHAYTMYHVPCTTFMSRHVMSCTLTTSHIYHVPYTMYHLFSCHLPFLTYLYCALLLCTPNAPQLYLSHPMYASPNCASIRSWVLPIPLSCLESTRYGTMWHGMA